jgi:REP element-mobilizing transposase RayT
LGDRNKTSQAGGLEIIVTRLEPSDCIETFAGRRPGDSGYSAGAEQRHLGKVNNNKSEPPPLGSSRVATITRPPAAIKKMSELRKANSDRPFFITLTVVGWIDVFIRGEYCEEFLKSLEFCRTNKGLKIYAYCIMSSHIHLIVSCDEAKLPQIIRDLKSFTAKKLIAMIGNNPNESRKDWLLYLFRYFANNSQQNKDHQFWQKTNHPTELITAKVFNQKVDYIHNNPLNSMTVNEPTAYVYSSANPDSIFRVDES